MKRKSLAESAGKYGPYCCELGDPIGIRDEPNAQDEYDSYGGRVCGLLKQRKSDDEIADFLIGVVRDRMGLDRATRQDMLPTVRALREISVESSQ